MEQERYQEDTDNLFDSQSKTSPCDAKTESASSQASVQSQELVESKCLVNNFASPTPEKTIQPSRSKNTQTALSVRAVKLFSKEYEDGASEDEGVEIPDGTSGYEHIKISDAVTEVAKMEIPDKYKPLADFFDRIDTSIRLLSLHKKLSTFQNICIVVKALTQRILSYSHLAQLKYVLPEAIHIEKILTHDEKTLCMMPDMKITLLLDVIEAHPGQSAFMALRQVFHQRLVDFSNSHSESFEIPEAVLPEPFSQRNHTVLPSSSFGGSSIESQRTPIECEPSLVSSSSGQSIRKHFSQKIVVPETEKTELLTSLGPPFSVNFADETDLHTRIPPQKECDLVSTSASITSPTALIFSSQCSYSGASESPSVKLDSFPHPLSVETPVQPTPAKRLPLLSSCEKMSNETRMLSQTAAKRSLNFGESKEYMDDSLQTAVAKNILADDNVTASPAVTQMVEDEKNQMNQTGPVRRQQRLASLIDLINTIQRIFKSASGSLVTKQELLQKIIADNLDIVDTREIEEQLELLEELVPDWIFRKLVPSGDLFYSIRRVSDLESIRARLSEAV